MRFILTLLMVNMQVNKQKLEFTIVLVKETAAQIVAL